MQTESGKDSREIHSVLGHDRAQGGSGRCHDTGRLLPPAAHRNRLFGQQQASDLEPEISPPRDEQSPPSLVENAVQFLLLVSDRDLRTGCPGIGLYSLPDAQIVSDPRLARRYRSSRGERTGVPHR